MAVSLKQATSLYREGIMSSFGLFNLYFALKVFLLDFSLDIILCFVLVLLG